MRYNRKTCEAELAVGEFCREENKDKRAYGLAELCGYTANENVITKNMCLKFEHNGVNYSVETDIIMKSGAICEFVTDRGNDKTQPVLHTTLIACYIYCCTEKANEVNINTVIINPDTLECSYVLRKKTFSYLQSFFMRRLCMVAPVAEMMKNRAENVLDRICDVKFPHKSLRNGQMLMMNECYEAMNRGKRLFVQAPTGIGKTVSVLYPAVKFLGQGKCDKIFYLTAKGSTQHEAYRTAGALFDSGAHLRTIIISAKEQICPVRQYICNGSCDKKLCRYYDPPEDRIMNAVNELLLKQNGYEHKIISETAIRWKVCPYELMLCLAEFCEIIIADYNYIFDPIVYLRRFFDDTERRSKYVFLIDEAHNLADRARNMYSSELSSDLFEGLKAEVKECLPELTELTDKVLAETVKIRELCADTVTVADNGVSYGFYLSHERYEKMDIELENMCVYMQNYLRRGSEVPFYSSISYVFGQIRKYIVISSYFDDNSVFYCETVGNKVSFKSICINPSSVLDMRMKQACSSILFSATLTPLDYFTDILGGKSDCGSIAIKSPFNENNLFLAAVTNISTRYEDRDKNVSGIVSEIAAAVSCKRGNYMVYFPSYDYMRKVYKKFSAKYPSVHILVQKKNMTREDRKKYLDEFRSKDDKMRLGFCVLGGSFSEGIDLPGNSLLGVIVVGVGMPGISGERNIMRDYFDITRECGYDYAYTYPGMNNVLQAVGRVIRSDEDYGIAVLIDDRYATPKYFAMYPDHWRKMKYFSDVLSLNQSIKDFWHKIS